MDVNLYTDGGSRGNPGAGAFAYLIKDTEGKVLKKSAQKISGVTTNNEAEYTALIAGLRACRGLGGTKVCHFSDSKLVVNQMNGAWRVKNERISELRDKAGEIGRGFKYLRHFHKRRSFLEISVCDAMLNAVLDKTEGPRRSKGKFWVRRRSIDDDRGSDWIHKYDKRPVGSERHGPKQGRLVVFKKP